MAPEKQRLQVDARKWLLSKWAPKKYGDRSAMELTGADGGPVAVTGGALSDADMAAKLAGILAMAKMRKDADGLV